MTYKMGLRVLWLIGDFEGEFGGMKFQGKFLDAYDPATKRLREFQAKMLRRLVVSFPSRCLERRHCRQTARKSHSPLGHREG